MPAGCSLNSRTPIVLAACLLSLTASAAPVLKFDFEGGKTPAGWTPAWPTNIYSRSAGFGFEPGAAVTILSTGNSRGCCASDRPFYFSVAVPDGNYRVTAALGDPRGASTNTIKAELRRLMVEDVRTAPGKTATVTFLVNVRTPQIDLGREVHLKLRERTNEMWSWDEKLTLEFNGSRPRLRRIEIARDNSVPTVYLLGDSTVCDQPSEPWNSWGQMLPRFFKPVVAVANNAESGETLKSALGAGRLDKVLSTMKPGDYLLIQFGHNDMKDRAPDALAAYKGNLKRFVADARARGGLPVLVTSMERKAGAEHPTLGDYPAAVRDVAREEHVPLIDLNTMSVVFYKALGTDLDKAFQDGTHHNNYGSYELAKCVVQGIRDLKLGLAKNIASDFKGFEPAHPDPVATFMMPASPGPIGQTPLGN